jgi:hypothetical protein
MTRDRHGASKFCRINSRRPSHPNMRQAALWRARPLPLSKLYNCRESVSRLTRRDISQIAAAKDSLSSKSWHEQTDTIRVGQRKSLLTILEERGYVKDLAGDRNALDKLLTDKQIGAYSGIDPTAPSLHLGHLLPMMVHSWPQSRFYHWRCHCKGWRSYRTFDQPTRDGQEHKNFKPGLAAQLCASHVEKRRRIC